MGVDYAEGSSRSIDTLILDVSYIAFRHLHAVKNRLMSSDGNPTGHILGSFRNLKSLVYELRPRRIIYCYDRGYAWRSELVPEYKTNRIQHIEGNWSPVSEVEELYRTFPGYHLSAEDCEADDMVAWAVRNQVRPGSTVIYSADKDLWQLVDDSQDIQCAFPYKAGKGKRTNTVFVNEEKVTEELGVHPSLVSKYKALFGDRADVIEGVKGGSRPGKKKQLLRFIKGGESDLFFDEYGVPDMSAIPDWLQEPMQQQRNRLIANWKITDLSSRDVDVEFSFTEGNPALTMELALNYECESLLGQILPLHEAISSLQSTG